MVMDPNGVVQECVAPEQRTDGKVASVEEVGPADKAHSLNSYLSVLNTQLKGRGM